MKPVISVASYSFHGLFARGAMSVFHYFDIVKYRYNLATADIWNMMLTSYDEDYLKLVRQMLDEHELTLVNLCCDGCHVWSNEEEERVKCAAIAKDCIRAAKILGAKTVRIDAGIREPEATDEQIDYCTKVYGEYCKEAADFGAKLGPENHWGATTNVTELRKLFQAAKADNFGLLLHLSNWKESADKSPEAILKNDREFAPRAMHTHIMYEVCEQAQEQLPALREAGYDGCGSWSVESHKSTNEYNNVAYQLAQVRRVLNFTDYKL